MNQFVDTQGPSRFNTEQLQIRDAPMLSHPVASGLVAFPATVFGDAVGVCCGVAPWICRSGRKAGAWTTLRVDHISTAATIAAGVRFWMDDGWRAESF